MGNDIPIVLICFWLTATTFIKRDVIALSRKHKNHKVRPKRKPEIGFHCENPNWSISKCTYLCVCFWETNQEPSLFGMGFSASGQTAKIITIVIVKLLYYFFVLIALLSVFGSATWNNIGFMSIMSEIVMLSLGNELLMLFGSLICNEYPYFKVM